ncbi:MAG: PHP domain-containing protein [Oscillospiraceae bacterium]|nr:PHP domain-containing protein [Oscillospiraceae bacterium]
MKVDLHCHTTLSDGSLGIEETIAQAKRNSIDCVAITDHDSLSSLSRSSILGRRYGITVIPAVEFSAFDGARKTKAHIICYLPQKPDRLEGLCMRNTDFRKKRGMSMARKVIEKYSISPDHIAKYSSGSNAIYKCHIMHALMDYGHTTRLYGGLYKKLFNMDDGLCSEEVKREIEEYPEVKFVIQLIRSAGGIAVLAHPSVYDNFELLEELAVKGDIDGVEVWHQSTKESDKDFLLAVAQKHNLITTGGSDFHGFYNHKAKPLGSNLTPSASLHKLQNFHSSIKKGLTV